MQTKLQLSPAERLVLALDLSPIPGGRREVRKKILQLMHQLGKTGICIKLNSVLRACGYDLSDSIKEHGFKVFADLKLTDIGNTLATDGMYLREARIDILTVMCTTGPEEIRKLKAVLPDTEILGVTVLTSHQDRDTRAFYDCLTEPAVLKLARYTKSSGLGGFVCSPQEVKMLREEVGEFMTLNTPGIRPAHVSINKDDQNIDRVMTPAEAIKAGADRIVVGRPILQADNPYDTIMRTIDEIASVTEA